MYIVVQFYCWFNIYFPLFYVVIYENKNKIKKKKIEPRIKLNHTDLIIWIIHNYIIDGKLVGTIQLFQMIEKN